MFSTSLCCCAVNNDNIIKLIEIGDDKMKKIEYKGNIYVLNEDIKIEEVHKFYDEKEERIEYPKEEGIYYLKKKYAVNKGYKEIEIFDTKEDAIDFVNEILKKADDENV